jgi:predicted PhzF superfamily epimerase YddE/YHI9
VRLADGADSLRLLRDMPAPAPAALLAVDQSALAARVTGVSMSARAGPGEATFVSRYFSPWNGIAEDPVNGSSHTSLAPYYAGAAESRVTVVGEMASQRGGRIVCTVDRAAGVVELAGRAVTVAAGELRGAAR